MGWQRLQAQKDFALGFDTLSLSIKLSTTTLGGWVVDLPANEEETAVNKRVMELAVENVGRVLSTDTDEPTASSTD